MLGEGGGEGSGGREGGKEGWIEGKERKQGIKGGRDGEGICLFLKGLKDIKGFWESDSSIQREKLALSSRCNP